MLDIIKLYPKGFAANSYLVTADGKTAIAIDPAQPRIALEAKKRGLLIKHILLTHGHFDHIGGCSILQRQSGAVIGCSQKEVALAQGRDNLAEEFQCPIDPFRVHFTLNDGDTLTLNGISVTVLATPGHTEGSVCYRIENSIFTGDTLFADGAGRTDLPTGNAWQLQDSLYRLRSLEDDCIVYAGHGADTTIGYEKKFNESMRV